MRINRFFTDRGICSRREADRAVEQGRITINGRTAVLGDKVLDTDVITFDGQVVGAKQNRPLVIAYNKPIGVVCTSDDRVPDNIIEAVNHPERIFTIGRLDQMSEGLILLTNRGELVNQILRARYGNEKEYHVELNEELPELDRRRLEKGVVILERKTAPCRIEPMGPRRHRWILTEGRNRQIRRMAEVVGLTVRRLRRVRVMNIELGDLPRGKWRDLFPEEITELLSLLQGD